MTKVSELAGAELDYWVAKAHGYDAVVEDGRCMTIHCSELSGWESHKSYFHPHEDWTTCGQIIERERIQLWDLGDKWMAKAGMKAGSFGCDKSPRIAAMRAYVSSKYGDSVPAGAQEASQ